MKLITDYQPCFKNEPGKNIYYCNCLMKAGISPAIIFKPFFLEKKGIAKTLIKSTLILAFLFAFTSVVCAQCDRRSIYDSILLTSSGLPTSICGGDSVNIGMPTVRGYKNTIFHSIRGVVAYQPEGDGGALSYTTPASLAYDRGRYTATATKDGCPTIYSKVVNIIYTGPQPQTLSGGGFYCTGSGGKTLSLNGSEAGLKYQLFKKGATSADPAVVIGMAITGTGGAISFAPVTVVGKYFVRSAGAGCVTSVIIDSTELFSKVQGLKITALTATTVNFQWAAATGVLGYQYTVTTSAIPPANGTVTSALTAAVGSLLSFRQYYLHVRLQCSGGYGEWTSVPFNTTIDCSLAPAITSCTNVTATLPPGIGEWDFKGISPVNSVGNATPGKEIMYSFTPLETGFYYIEMISAGSGYVDYLFKPAADGCKNTGWQGIGRFNQADTGSSKQKSIGRLVAGTKYLFVLDNETGNQPGPQVFKICKTDPPDCTKAKVIGLCADITAVILPGYGAWDSASPTNSTPGKELLYSFKPEVTGFYYLEMISGGDSYVDYSFKQATAGCTNLGWTRLTSFSNSAFDTSGSNQQSFGELKAGVQYFLLMDKESVNKTETQRFRICKTNPPDCSKAPIIDPCTETKAFFPRGHGAWDFAGTYPNNSVGNSTPGREILYRFTPTATGLYYINFISSEGFDRLINCLVKPAASGCTNTGWKGIGINNTDRNILMGQLQSGVPYYILLDKAEANFDDSIQFKICKTDDRPDCSAGQPVSLCTVVDVSIPEGEGYWDFHSLFSQSTGKEAIFNFTPDVTGFYSLDVTSIDRNGNINYWYKADSSGCNDAGWIDISGFGTGIKNVGLLQGGIKYNILADNNNMFSAREQTFKLCKIDEPDCAVNKQLLLCTPDTAEIPAGLGAWNFAGEGKEKIYSFTPAVTGSYYIEAGYGNGSVNFFYKKAAAGCNDTGWVTLGDLTGKSKKIQESLLAGVKYFILLANAHNSSTTTPVKICKIDPPDCTRAVGINVCTNVPVKMPSGIGAWDFAGIYPKNSAGNATPGKEIVYSFTPTISGDYYVEVTAGNGYVDYLYKQASNACTDTGWIGIGNFYSDGAKKIPGRLLAGIKYFILLDNLYNGAFEQTFRVCKIDPPNCAAAKVITTCKQNAVSISGFGAWDFAGTYPDNSAGSATVGKEVVYSFTPLTSGNYYLIINSGGNNDYIDYLYKPAAATCSDSGWTGIGRFNINSNRYKNIGQLQAGVKYLILLDGETEMLSGQTFSICATTPPDCTASPAVQLCTVYNTSISGSKGSWDFNTPYNRDTYDQFGGVNGSVIDSFYTDGLERIYKLNPTMTGSYFLDVNLAENIHEHFNFYYKPISAGCNDQNWIRIGSYGGNTPAVQQALNLIAGTPYYLMLDGQISSSGDSLISFEICNNNAPDCSTSREITLCEPDTAYIPAGIGWWDFGTKFNGNTSSGYATPGMEQIYKFTPAKTGFYGIEILSSSGYSSDYVDYLYKPISEGCAITGWKPIAGFGTAGTKRIGQQLQAGIGYYILLDNETTRDITQAFRICKIEMPVCDPAPVIRECIPLRDTIPAGLGAWDFAGTYPNNSVGPTSFGKEKIYSFTPVSTDYYSLQVTAATGGYVNYLYKKATGTCSDSGWTGIAKFNAVSGKNIGLLSAGIKYYFVLDNEDKLIESTQTFRICKTPAATCAPAPVIRLYDTTSVSIPAGIGSWDSYSPGTLLTDATVGKEAFFKFIPTATGKFSLNFISGGNVQFYFKSGSNNCVNDGWAPFNGVAQNLQSGVEYLIMADNSGIQKNDIKFEITEEGLFLCTGQSYTIVSSLSPRPDGEITWYENGTPVNGGNTGQLILTSIPGNHYGYEYQAILDGQNVGGPRYHQESALFTIKFKTTWNGNISADWNNPANWSCNAVPDQYTDVIIPPGTVYSPVLNINTTIKKLIVQPGAIVTIQNNFKLTIKEPDLQ